MTWLRDRRNIALLGGSLCLAAAGASCFAMFNRKWRDDTSNSRTLNPAERLGVNHFKHWCSNITHFPKAFKPFGVRSPSAEGILPSRLHPHLAVHFECGSVPPETTAQLGLEDSDEATSGCVNVEADDLSVGVGGYMQPLNENRKPRYGEQSSLFATLPVELLEQIFEFCTPSAALPAMMPLDYHEINIPFPERIAILTLGQVCMRWRAVTRSRPSLWASIVLGGNGSVPRCEARLLEMRMARSMNVSLSLTILDEITTARDIIWRIEDDQPLAYLIEKAIKRCRHCRVRLCRTGVAVRDVVRIFVALHHAKEIEDLVLDTDLKPMVVAALLGGDPMRRLRSLTCIKPSGMPAFKGRRMITPPFSGETFSNMRRIFLRGQPLQAWDQLFDWLSHFPKLEEFEAILNPAAEDTSVNSDSETLHEDREERSCRLEFLHTFSLRVNGGSVIGGPRRSTIRDQVVLPALRTLHLRAETNQDSTNLSDVEKFLLGSDRPSQMSELDLHCGDHRFEDVVVLLASAPRLEILRIDGNHRSMQDLFKAITLPEYRSHESPRISENVNMKRAEQALVCPVLKELYVANALWDEESIPGALDMLHPRIPLPINVNPSNSNMTSTTVLAHPETTNNPKTLRKFIVTYRIEDKYDSNREMLLERLRRECFTEAGGGDFVFGDEEDHWSF